MLLTKLVKIVYSENYTFLFTKNNNLLTASYFIIVNCNG